MIEGRNQGFDWGMSPHFTLLVEGADEIGLYSVFSSAEALQKYAVSEAHVDVVTNHVKPNVDGREYLRCGDGVWLMN